MKQFAGISLILVAAATPSFAQSMLKVSLADRAPITVSVDGRHFRKAGESITVNDLPKGKHYVMVYLADDGRNGRRPGVIWEGKIKTYHGQVSNCVVDPYSRQASITEQDMYGQPQPADAERYSNYNLNNYDSRQPVQDDAYTNTQDPNANNPQSASQYQGGNDNNYAPLPDGAPVASPVSGYDEDELLKNSKTAKTTKSTKVDSKVEAIRKKINAKNTDTDKLEAAKAAMKTSSVKTADVIALMDCFNFESTKMDFAKWAYTRTSDKTNYKQVKQKLTMKQYREDMDTFLKNN